jgi:hypothetical protein
MKTHLLVLCLLVSQSRGFAPTPCGARRQTASVLAVSFHSTNDDDHSDRRKVMNSLIAAGLSFVPSISNAKVRGCVSLFVILPRTLEYFQANDFSCRT